MNETIKYNANIKKSSIVQGGLRPHKMLTNISVAYFQDASDFIAPSVFPVIPVDTSDGLYPIFNREDLARDNFQEKPEFGHVSPAVFSSSKGNYSCGVDQILVGLDKIQQVNNSRITMPSSSNPRLRAAATVSEQALLHLDSLFAKNFFQEGVWTNEWTGAAADNDGNKEFIKFSDANSEPLKLIRKLKREQKRKTRYTPNVMLLGPDVFDALCEHPDFLNRVIHGGSTLNPADVDERVIAQLTGIPTVKVLESTMNKAELGLPEDMDFICDSKAIFLGYVNPTPAIDRPSAGYIFSWDPTGNKQPLTITNYDGRPEDHVEWIEGLASFDMRKVCDDMGIFLKECI